MLEGKKFLSMSRAGNLLLEDQDFHKIAHLSEPQIETFGK